MSENFMKIYGIISQKRINEKRPLNHKEFLNIINNNFMELSRKEYVLLEQYSTSLLSFDEIKIIFSSTDLSEEDKLSLRSAFYKLSRSLTLRYNELCYSYGYGSQEAISEENRIAPIITDLVSFIYDRNVIIDEELVEFWIPCTYLTRKIS